MHAKYLTSAVAAIALSGTVAFASQPTNPDANNSEHRWMPKQPVSTYWQAPNFNFPTPEKPARPDYAPPQHMPAMMENPYRPPAASRPAPTHRPSHPSSPGMNRADMSRPGMNRPRMDRPNMNQPGMNPRNMNRQNMNRQNMNCPNMNCPNMNQRSMNQRSMQRPDANRMPPMQNPNRGYPPRGPYYGPDTGASAYNMPGYNPNRNYRGNNRGNNNKFWGRSGPSTWMNPSKRNWENSWDDMINSPSRMGTMPGGWTAPEVSMPNPIDMGDQMQDNVKDLPEQMKDMNVGNDVKN